MNYYLIAGEASGDLHGSNLMRGLKEVDPQARFRFWGGDRMQEQGGELVRHYRDHNIMGFWEVLTRLGKIRDNFRVCKADLLEHHPDVLILIDYPGFNLRMARFAKKHGIQVFYYISPKIWAWKESRIHKIKAWVDQMFVIFPFEVDFYARHDFPVVYEGNPLIDAVDGKLKNKASFDQFIQRHGLEDKPIVAILPGSRKQEIDRNLGEMIRVIRHFPDHQYIIAGAPSIEKSYYEQYLAVPNLSYVHDQTYELLSHSRAAIITSGTATLEAALFDVPQVVCYKANAISYRIARHFVKVPYISLVNLNMQQEVVKELIQNDMNDQSLYQELKRLLYDQEYTERMHSDYNQLRVKLGGSGASRKVARAMYVRLQNTDR
jgi:lipid-A-disaccharide synthase